VEKGTNNGLDGSDGHRAIAVVGLVRPLFLDGGAMRKMVATSLYLMLVEVVALFLVVSPVHALTSTTGYVRVIPSTAVGAYLGANRAAVITSLATSIALPSATSVAVRLVAGPVGWAGLAVTAGLALAQFYYSNADVTALRSATNGDGSMVSGINTKMPFVSLSAGSCTSGAACAPSTQHAKLDDPNAYPYCGYYWTAPSAPPGWTTSAGVKPGITPTTCCTICGEYTYTNQNAVGSQNAIPGYVGPADATHMANYLGGLPTTDAKAPEHHAQPIGEGVTPTEPSDKTTVAVTPSQVVPTVKPIGSVAPSDAMIDPNANPVAPTTTTQTQTQTTTTTTTTNPDGSKTETSEGTASCTTSTHDSRSFGSILQAHLQAWQGSGLLSALNLLKTLTWPSDLTSYGLSSTVLGGATFAINFAEWGGIITALRSLIIALAGFVAYRIIFVGST
jgi:hypothetical protein